MFQIAEPESAPLLLNRDAVEAEFAHRRPQLTAWKPVLAIGAVGERSDLFVGAASGGLAEHSGGCAASEIAIGGGRHGQPLGRCGKREEERRGGKGCESVCVSRGKAKL